LCRSAHHHKLCVGKFDTHDPTLPLILEVRAIRPLTRTSPGSVSADGAVGSRALAAPSASDTNARKGPPVKRSFYLTYCSGIPLCSSLGTRQRHEAEDRFQLALRGRVCSYPVEHRCSVPRFHSERSTLVLIGSRGARRGAKPWLEGPRALRQRLSLRDAVHAEVRLLESAQASFRSKT
jgi:hypothetical protein